MKRDRDHGKREAAPASTSTSAAAGISNIWTKAPPPHLNAGMDELLEVLGYRVQTSDMAGVANKLQQIEMANENGASVLSTDTVHYNPSDLSGWVESMVMGRESSSSSNNPFSSYIYDDDDLRAIPGDALFSKKVKLQSSSSSSSMLLVNPEETGVRLVRCLMACAEAVQADNLKLADILLKHIRILAVSDQVGAMGKVATCFAEALARKIYKIYPNDTLQSSYTDDLQMHFYETTPYLKFAHFTANQAILEAFGNAKHVHVIDFNLSQGMQWPPLMQALALRPNGPPRFRLTGIGPPQCDNNDALQKVGLNLARLAEVIGIQFEFRSLVTTSLADLVDVNVFQVRPSEVVAVNSIFELHRLLNQFGDIEKVLNLVKGLNPKIVTVVEQEANHNGDNFLERFHESLHYYSSMFDSLPDNDHDLDSFKSEVYLGREICNIVASNGVFRVERHEKLTQWRVRMSSAGFLQVHIGSNVFKQASMLLSIFAGGDGYRVEENDGSLMLAWHTRPLIASSAWQLKGCRH